MNILLINPSQEKVYGIKMPQVYPPLGLLYVGTVLRNAGHNVKLIDIDVEQATINHFKKTLGYFCPKVVGITSVTPTINDAIKWAREVKKYDKSIKIIMGGIHPTIAPIDIAKEEVVDFVVVGEAEETIIELIKAIEDGSSDFSEIKGIVYKNNTKIVQNQRRGLIQNLDEIEFPDRSLLRSLNHYVPVDAIRTPVATILTSRGCPGDCTFCCTKLIFTRHVRLRSIDNIINEIDLLVNKYNVREIHIADDTFTINKKRVLDFCGKVRKKHYNLNFEFMNGLRADYVDEDILKALKSIKVTNVGFGVESGSEEILKLAKKNINLDKVRNAFSIAKKLSFETWAFFLIGLPGENTKTIKQTIDFAKELDPDFAKFYILKPYPGSEVYRYLCERNLIESYDYDKYGIYTEPVHYLPQFSKLEMIRWQKKAFKSFYLRPKKIIRHLMRIRSITRLRLALRGFLFVVFNILKRER